MPQHQPSPLLLPPPHEALSDRAEVGDPRQGKEPVPHAVRSQEGEGQDEGGLLPGGQGPIRKAPLGLLGIVSAQDLYSFFFNFG